MESVPDVVPWVIALDLDGTVIGRDGSIGEAVMAQVHRVAAAGHQVVLATGRSYTTTAPVLEQLGIVPRFVVCSNGAVVLEAIPEVPGTYRRRWVESFDPTDTLQLIRAHLGDGGFAVEDEHGHIRYAGTFPDDTTGIDGERVEFEELLGHPAARVVVIAPGHDRQEFLELVEQMGLHQVSYTVGWTAWLDVAAGGVNKATATERVRHALGIPRQRVMAVGDGLNDIELLRWAAAYDRGIAMGQSPSALLDIANERTGTVGEDGLADVLGTL